MGESVPRDQVHIDGFKGMSSAPDPGDLPEGFSVEQRNVHSVKPGELTIRQGLKPMVFDD